MFKEGIYKHTILFSEAEQKKIDELQKNLNLTYKSEVIRYCVNKSMTLTTILLVYLYINVQIYRYVT
jgi:hypothetical protein